MELMDNVGQVLNLYNYYSGAIMANHEGVIEYYYNNRKDINTLTEKEVVGKSIFDVYPEITPNNSTLIEAIRTGESMTNTYQVLSNYKGETYSAICDTVPVFDNEKIIGAIEVFMYMEENDKYMNIFISNEQKYSRVPISEISSIISISDVMEKLKERIIKTSWTKSTVLIFGETGTGKELIARAIHNCGPRKNKRFISQNCAAIPENLLESLLFGTVKGSFTGAENRIGLFEAANGGTLFLDEINSMDKVVQAKILKAIEEQCIMRVGGINEISVDVRVITATNVEPLVCVEKGTLREDLYYRLKVVELRIPPLRNRKNDIEPLIVHYLALYNRTMGKNIKDISENIKKMFINYSWPGNVRELRNIIEGAFNLCEGEYIDVADLDMYALQHMSEEEKPWQDDSKCQSISLKDRVRSYERNILIKAIKENENLTKAADNLGITRQTLNNKIRELKILKEEIERS